MFFLICLVLFSKNNLSAAKEGLTLWATCVVPSLFPFFVATELLNFTNITAIFGKLLSPIMRPVFNIPGEGAYALIMGIISGCPIGAKIVCDIYNAGICTKDEAERMLAFTNNSGPLFVIGTVGIILFRDSTIGFLLLLTHILSAISVGIVFGFSSRIFPTKKTTSNLKYHSNKNKQYKTVQQNNLASDEDSKNNKSSISNLGEIISISISKSITNTLQIGGFVVLFSVILSILNKLNVISGLCDLFAHFSIPYDFSNGFISGIVELTNGVNIVCNIHTKTISNVIITCSFLLGFGGLSILLQVLSIISKVGLSIKNYFYGKVLQGMFAVFYTTLLIKHCFVFNLDIPSYNESSILTNYGQWILFSLLILCILFVVLEQKRKCYS